MRVLFLLRSTNPKAGGVETATNNLATEFQLHNCEVSVAAYSAHADCLYRSVLILDEQDMRSNIVRCQKFIVQNSIDVVINQIYGSQSNTELIENLKLRGGVKVITCLHTTPSFFSDQYRGSIRFSARRNSKDTIKWLLRLGALPYYWYIRIHKARKLLYRDYAASDRFVVLSESYKELFCSMYRSAVDPSRIEVVYNPMSNTFYDAPQIAQKRNEIIYVGRLAVEKQVDLTLKVWGKISHHLPDWSLRMVGDGPAIEFLQQYAADNGIERVEWCGFTSNPIPYYDRAKMLMLTSLHEGLPMTIVEAQCRGVVPVLSNSFGAAAEMVDGGDSGVIVELKEVMSRMPEMIVQLASDPTSVEKLSQSARVKAEQYRSSVIWKEWERLLSE